jgi:hypothetical protein
MMPVSYPRHQKAHDYAVHCLGVHESPARSNHGPIQVSNPQGGVDFFETHDFVAGNGYAWCACFWLTCWAEAGHTIPYRSPGAHALGDWARKAGWAKPINQLIPGDGCDWNEGSGHLSMFERFDAATGLVHTIDGNWGDKVQRATHTVGGLRTGIHVPETGVQPPAPKPYWVIATSVNGHRKILFTQYATKKRILGLLPRLLHRYGVTGVTVTRSKRKPTT